MRVLVGCEFSGIVREAFIARGHDAWSVDIIDTEIPGNHIINSIFNVYQDGWDMGIFFPPCTALCNSGNRYYARTDERERGLEFVFALMEAPIPKICIENPPGAISSNIEKPTQIIHPWQFGHDELKTTHLWLYGLPKLEPTNVIPGPYRDRVHNHVGPGPNRWKDRSRTYQGIANAMAKQWG